MGAAGSRGGKYSAAQQGGGGEAAAAGTTDPPDPTTLNDGAWAKGGARRPHQPSGTGGKVPGSIPGGGRRCKLHPGFKATGFKL